MKFQALPPVAVLCRLCVLLLLLPSVSVRANDDGPVVMVQQGSVLGRVVNQPGARLPKYYAFEGIPFGRPPVGEKRFKDPEEAEAWSGVRNATAPGAHCIQRDLFSDKISGEEDCLFVNVFTADPPEAWASARRPVAVWVHGGAFLIGSGDMDNMRPDALLRHGLLIVSFNYRLSVMGFLSTQDADAPGNAGLKDAVLALRWVQKNVEAFGGDPSKVTIFGDSAGAAIVHYLLLSPLTEGLVHRAISMSGQAHSRSAASFSPRRDAVALRDALAAAGACPDAAPDAVPDAAPDVAPDAAPDAVLRCLRAADAALLVDKHDVAPPPELMHRFWKNPFLPTVEAPGSTDTPFLVADPETLMKEGRFQKVPYITGFTSAEGILYLKFGKLLEDPSNWAKLDANLEAAFQNEMPLGLRTREAMRQVREFYLGDRSLADADKDPETLRRFVQMCTDVLFAVEAVDAARLMTRSGARVYVYEFTHEVAHPVLKTLLYNASHVGGVAHGDDLASLFNFALRRGGAPPPAPPVDDSVRERRVRLFTHFARTGNPTPADNESLSWPLFNADRESYLDFGSAFVVHDHVLGERGTFWQRLANSTATAAQPARS